MSRTTVGDCDTHWCYYNEDGDCLLTDIFISDGECASFKNEESEDDDD